MGIFTHEFATPSSVAPARLYKAMALDFHNLFPKIVDSIQCVETIEGNGAAGTIKKITLVEGQVEEVDEAKRVYNYSIIGGVGLPETWEKISFETIVMEGPKEEGGSIRKVNIKYFTKGDAEVCDEVLKSNQSRAEGLLKFIEAYLLANPHYV
ncbi:class-10 pathogenesis-related protein 1 [Arachis duranensis]|uniref:Class-10 pathogenesis-related protein 1 n=1 Tax=Arachis duranensis TaxID=130453 RepID=A0A9C6WUZ9_ARADU|nr:class-10 pathogenesis-related protein 1 [Arachis duranensis]